MASSKHLEYVKSFPLVSYIFVLFLGSKNNKQKRYIMEELRQDCPELQPPEHFFCVIIIISAATAKIELSAENAADVIGFFLTEKKKK